MRALTVVETVAVLQATDSAPIENVDRRQIEWGFKAGLALRDEQVNEIIYQLILDRNFTPEAFRQRLKEVRGG